MRLLICAGGTGGGVFPALAVLQALKEINSSWDSKSSVLWVGGEDGMEQDILSRQDIELQTIPAAGIHGVGVWKLPGNMITLLRGYFKAGQILRNYRPDVLFFTGGYLAVPAAFAGRSIPSLVFIPDIEPGLAIKTIANLSARIAVTVDQTVSYLPQGKPAVVTGYPVRDSLLLWERDDAVAAFNLVPDLPILLVFGGSKGARSINRALAGILPDLLQDMQVIHISGKLDFEEMSKNEERLTEKEKKNYRLFQFLHNRMGAALRCADLVVSRSGASVLGEYPAFGLPAILVPYPHAWRYQMTNASYLVHQGAAETILDEELTNRLLPTLKRMMRDPEQLSIMATAMRKLARPDAAQRIASQLLSLGGGQEEGLIL